MSKIKITMGFLLAILVGARASDEAAPPGDAPLEPFWLKPQMQLGKQRNDTKPFPKLR